ncbi:hypothetical protein ABZ568_22505 [Streptomyces olindensis]|uniref:Uncharacterized protein n=1 Tax=Streptomyces olindensis TaxID=358823 RepID=A0ABV2XYP5_9ACTN
MADQESYGGVIRRARRAERVGWTAIGCVSGLLGLALVALVAGLLVLAVAAWFVALALR